MSGALTKEWPARDRPGRMLCSEGCVVEVNGAMYRVAATAEFDIFLVYRIDGGFLGAFSVEGNVVAVDPDDEPLLRSIAEIAARARVVPSSG